MSDLNEDLNIRVPGGGLEVPNARDGCSLAYARDDSTRDDLPNPPALQIKSTSYRYRALELLLRHERLVCTI